MKDKKEPLVLLNPHSSNGKTFAAGTSIDDLPSAEYTFLRKVHAFGTAAQFEERQKAIADAKAGPKTEPKAKAKSKTKAK